MNNKRVLVCGGSGFIGTHWIKRLLSSGFTEITVVDISKPFYLDTAEIEFIQADLRDFDFCSQLVKSDFDEIYQFAADMGGAGYIFTGESDADIVTNSAAINLNILRALKDLDHKPKIFYSSSACIYPQSNQTDPENPNCEESSAYPADPDSEYGWEKLFSERLYLSYLRNYNVDVKIGRFHNVYGPLGVWNNGKEKAPSAICRKIAEADNNGSIEIWGDGLQTRSFLYIDDCLDAIELFMKSDEHGPLNIGSDEMVSINELAGVVMNIADKKLSLDHIEGPQGVRGRCSHNQKIAEALGWKQRYSLTEGMEKTYAWIHQQVQESVVSE